MTNKFYGTIEQLRGLIDGNGNAGDWSEDVTGKFCFRSKNGGILNWWPKTGTLQLQGSARAKELLEMALKDGDLALTSVESTGSSYQVTPQQIFIVHGHDSDARDQLELALHRLGLQPYILMNNSGGGKTIVEALEGKIGRDYTSDFGIVLMTPDDFGYSKKDGVDKAEPRARQNVILEAGMLLSSLTRERMAIVVKGHLELPSDLNGIIYLGYNEHVREIIPKLCQRLKESGFEMDSGLIASATQ